MSKTDQKRPAVARTLPELKAAIAGWQAAGESHALVPTMGALHDGHLALVQLARGPARRTVVSIFVNPRQFGPKEDLSRYPRDEAGDLAKLASVDCDLVWAPSPEVMYPQGFATTIVPGGAAEGLESDFRPGFFSGVATVCCKLFTQVAPTVAVFGEKDFQQLAVVRQLVRDLNLPLEIVGAPTLREADGLAMSSRNRYLSPEERKVAPAIHKAVVDVAKGKPAEKAIGYLSKGGLQGRLSHTSAMPPHSGRHPTVVPAGCWWRHGWARPASSTTSPPDLPRRLATLP